MGAAITGWGSALPDQVVTNDDFAARLDTTDEWIVERTGIRERRMGGHDRRSSPIEAGAQRARSAPASTGADIDLLVLATTTPDQAIPATSSAVHDALGLSRRGLRPERRVRRVRLRPRRRRRAPRRDGATRASSSARRRSRAGHRPGRPRDRRPLRRRRGGDRPRVRDARRARPLARPRRRRLGASTPLRATTAASSNGGQRGLPPGRPRRDRLDQEGARARPGSARRHRPVRPPPGQRPHHRGGERASSASRWSRPRSCSTAPATPRPPRSRSRSPRPPTPAGSHEGDLVLLSGFGAGMTWASRGHPLGRGGRATGERRRRVVLVTGRLRGHRARLRPPVPGRRRPRRRDLPQQSPDELERRRRHAAHRSPCAATSPRPSDVEAAFAEIEAELGPVEVLVCSAGITDDACSCG